MLETPWDFFDFVGKLINKYWGDKITYQVASSTGSDPLNINPPIITYNLLQMTPAQEGGTPKPRLSREVAADNGSSIIDYYWSLNATVEFSCIGSTVKQAWEVADRLQSLMLSWASLFKYAGLNEVLFTSARLDPDAVTSGQVMPKVKLEYLIVYRRVYRVYVPPIGEIEVIAGVSRQSQ